MENVHYVQKGGLLLWRHLVWLLLLVLFGSGILKDYLRELPSPLITRTLYEVVLEAMSLRPACRTDADSQRCPSTVSLLHCLPEPEKVHLLTLPFFFSPRPSSFPLQSFVPVAR